MFFKLRAHFRAAYTPVFITSVSHIFISIIYVYQDQRKQNKILQIQESLKAGTFQSYSLLICAADTGRGGGAAQHSASDLGT